MKKLLVLLVILGSGFFYQAADAQTNAKPGYSFHERSDRRADYKKPSRRDRRHVRKAARHHHRHEMAGHRHHRHHRHF